jgi:hypothetical protein
MVNSTHINFITNNNSSSINNINTHNNNNTHNNSSSISLVCTQEARGKVRDQGRAIGHHLNTTNKDRDSQVVKRRVRVSQGGRGRDREGYTVKATALDIPLVRARVPGMDRYRCRVRERDRVRDMGRDRVIGHHHNTTSKARDRGRGSQVVKCRDREGEKDRVRPTRGLTGGQSRAIPTKCPLCLVLVLGDRSVPTGRGREKRSGRERHTERGRIKGKGIEKGRGRGTHPRSPPLLSL